MVIKQSGLHLFFVHLSCLLIDIALLINNDLKVLDLPLLYSNFQILVHFLILLLICTFEILLHELFYLSLIFRVLKYYVYEVFQDPVNLVTFLGFEDGILHDTIFIEQTFLQILKTSNSLIVQTILIEKLVNVGAY